MSNKKTVFISHSHKDKSKVNLLKGQLPNSSEINVAFVSEPPASFENIYELINHQIDNSSMMLVMVGEDWSKWQEYELENALKKGVPVVGLLSNKNNEIKSPILTSENVPIVNWSWNEISKVLAGETPTLDYTLRIMKN